MGTILVIASSKGGVSKTTTSWCLAVNLVAQGYSVAAIDADRNQAFATWHKMASPPLPCSTCIDQNEIVGHAQTVAESCDVVIVDTAGFENQTAVFAMGTADLVVIPVMPDRNSVLEAGKTHRQVASVSKIARRSIPSRVLLSRWKPRGIAERATLEDIDSLGLPRFSSHLPDLTAFNKASYGGEVPTTGSAGEQIVRIIEEIVALGALPPRTSSRNRRSKRVGA